MGPFGGDPIYPSLANWRPSLPGCWFRRPRYIGSRRIWRLGVRVKALGGGGMASYELHLGTVTGSAGAKTCGNSVT